MPTGYKFDDLDLRVEPGRAEPLEDAMISAFTRACSRTEGCSDSCCTVSC